MDSTVGLGIQCVGIFLVTMLSFFIMHTVQGLSAKYWTLAWTCLAVSLASLFTGFHVTGLANHICYSLYFFGEYSFGLLFIAGCRNHTQGEQLGRRSLWIFSPFVVVAAVLPLLSQDFNNLFIVQASIMAFLFAAAFIALRPALLKGIGTPGERVMRTALFLLSVDFLHYVLVFTWHQRAWSLPVPDSYFRYTSILDLILEILLGFATIMVLMEGVRREIEAANSELTAARDRLEQIVHFDPLTDALSRHAFHALLAGDKKRTGGSVGVIDVDNLKPINDTYGHTAGDAALRAVARAIRVVIRSDDLLFRWGGDEFLVLMFGLPEQLARQRLDSLKSALAKVQLPNVASALEISVSCGISSFGAVTDLDRAREEADRAMYKSKQIKKALIG
jgi:diguanylate cyclase (GGDEF)-like protein